MLRSLALPILATVVAATLAGCDGATAPDDAVTPARGVLGDTPEVTVPDTVRANVPFTVLAVTTANDGCAAMGETRVSVSGLLAVVEPYDLLRDGALVICPAIVQRFSHRATVTFTRAGAATVRIVGGDVDVTRPVVVLP